MRAVRRSRPDTGDRRGSVILEHDSAVIRVEFESEFLTVALDGEMIATCPDIVTLLDVRTGAFVSCESVHQGHDVAVLVLPGPQWWADEVGRLKVVGPAGIRDRPRRSADGGAMSASVSALLNNPAFVGLYRLAGEGDPVVTTVGALTGESAQSAEAVSGAASSGSVLVILDRIDIGEWRFDALLRRTAATGCQVGRCAQRLRREDANLSLLADRLGLVVLGVSDPWQFSVVIFVIFSRIRGAVMADAVLRATHAGQRAGGSVENLLVRCY